MRMVIDPGVNQSQMAHFSSNVLDLILPLPISKGECRFFVGLQWDAEAGAPLATLFGQVALFAASLCLQKMRLRSEYDHSGIKTAILYHICSVLLCYTNRWSRLGFLRRRCGVKVNLIANFICSIVGILLEKFYEKSLASLCFALTMTILFLFLLVIIQPRTDLGFFGFLIGATGSVAYNLFQLKLGTWIVVAICSLLLAFKRWLDKHWLEPEVEESQSFLIFDGYIQFTYRPYVFFDPGPVIRRIDALIVVGLYLVWAYIILSTNCLNSKSCASCSTMENLKCEAIYDLWLCLAYIHRVYYLFQVKFWVLPMPYTKARAKAMLENFTIIIEVLSEARSPMEMYTVKDLMV